ncbi:hypothetical protein PIB30_083875 [Stylosanthes scabra]|uniref:Uncharacterized protein n=1 Tax=Stylosanthes scabra TaxID=79078 RepID=A0ABU6TRX1_9FABA|nr:hypothetical protein [Stylosanthes scabra]
MVGASSVVSSGKCIRWWSGTSTGPVGLAKVTDRDIRDCDRRISFAVIILFVML